MPGLGHDRRASRLSPRLSSVDYSPTSMSIGFSAEIALGAGWVAAIRYNLRGAELCPSGRRSAIGNRVAGVEPARGFESHRLRHAAVLNLTETERIARDAVLASVREQILQGAVIRLPDFDPRLSRPSDRFALTSVGLEPNPFGACVGEYRYQIEGEEDLLHLIVTR